MFALQKRAGRPRVLHEEELGILDRGRIVTLEGARTFLRETLSVDITGRRLRQRLTEMGIVSRKAELLL